MRTVCPPEACVKLGTCRGRRLGQAAATRYTARLPRQLTVAELVALFGGYYPAPMSVAEAVRLAGLEGLERRRCSALSGGQQRRLQFAIAAVGRRFRGTKMIARMRTVTSKTNTTMTHASAHPL